MIRLRASDLEAWRRYVEPEMEEWAVSTEDFIRGLLRQKEPTDAMRAGTAFHSVLEEMRAGHVVDVFEADGFTFRFDCDTDVYLPEIREAECEPLLFDTPHGLVSLGGRTDARDWTEVVDAKLTGSFDAERYADSMQWRTYLTLTGCKRFRYVCFEQKTKGSEVTIHAVHELTMWAYPEMRADVERRVVDLAGFIVRHVPEMVTFNPTVEV